MTKRCSKDTPPRYLGVLLEVLLSSHEKERHFGSESFDFRHPFVLDVVHDGRVDDGQANEEHADVVVRHWTQLVVGLLAYKR